MLTINKITIVPGAGCFIEKLQREMFDMSVKYNCEVTANFNGCTLKVLPKEEQDVDLKALPVEEIENHLSMEEQEFERIKRALNMHFGCKPCAAKQLGISERTLSRKIKEYGL